MRAAYGWSGLGMLAVASVATADAPPGRYTFDTPELVYDTRTKLSWQRAVPSSYSPACSGKYSSSSGTAGDACTWEDAKKYCSGLSLAGMSGWRLPTRAELLTIVDRTKANPAIDLAAFPGTNPQGFWSSSPFVGSSGGAWVVGFDGGGSGSDYVSGVSYRVRCVR